MMKIRGAYPVRSGWDLNLCLRVLLALLFACAGIVHAKPLPVSGASLPSHVRAVAPNGSTNSTTCGQTFDATTGWSDPCDLQTALARARDNNSPVTELWLKTGTYYPSGSDRFESFEISSGLMVLGGFSGTESVRAERPNNTGRTNFTVLSGNINSSTNTSDNSYQVVTIRAAESVAILDQVVITNGYATHKDHDQGGGLYISDSKVYISNSKITDNFASEDGGGIFVGDQSDVTLVFSEVTFNEASKQGGGMYAEESSVTIRNSVFFGNTSNGGDGAYAGVKGSLDVANAIFYAASGAEQPIDVHTGSENQTVEIAYSLLADECGNHAVCSVEVDTTSDPEISIRYVNGIPVLSLPEDSPFFEVASENETPQDIYFIYSAPQDPIPDFPYNVNGIPTIYPSPTAVTVYDFSAAPEAGGILLTWETATEIDNLGFNLYRRAAGSAEFNLVNPSLIASQSPGSLLGAVYSFFDPANNSMLYTYRLQALDADGSIQSFDLTYRPSTSASSDLRPRIFLPIITRR